MKERRLAFLQPPEIEGLAYPEDCPFKTARADLTRRRLRSFGSLGGAGREEIAPRKACLEELARFHTPDYLAELQRAAAGDLTVEGLHMGLGSPDTPVFPALFDYGAWACGAGLTAAELLLEGRFDVVFNLLGGFHHAGAARAAGFCYLNDVVLACECLARAGRRVVCLDVDAHHGDGTQAAFYARRDVLTISLHESGKTLFPWGGFEDEIGEGAGEGFNANVSLPARTYDTAFLAAVDRVVRPLLRAYDPDVLVVELGADTLAGDPLTHLSLTNNALRELIQRLLELERPVLLVGGGGYHVENTVRAWALAWQTFAGEDADDLSLGMGGVFLGNSEWAGGLRDPVLPVAPEQRAAVDGPLENAICEVQRRVFPRHGLPASEAIPPRGAGSTPIPLSGDKQN
ncbi:MAG: acetoin utilization protein AcuC [Verrucomicrobiales bacterium]|nr:acetoin utilization protein AcuC [Verrucomicrobiales bacterium]MCP5526856.1 acetoin utilization protein AcuC [Verrucomicrobiales bacterium]